MAVKKGGLGKGLDSLIPNKQPAKETKTAAKQPAAKQPYEMVSIELVTPNPDQPRKQFTKDSLKELTASVKAHGIIQPLIVTKRDGTYVIIAGERRYRAAKQAGLKKIPVIWKDYDEKEVLEISLIENIQREDLNPIEEAQAYRRLIDEFGLKQDEIAKRVSKSRSAVTNSMRLLKLSPEVAKMLKKGQISAGHARALLPLTDPEAQLMAAKEAADGDLSVRQTEMLVKRLLSPKKPEKKKESPDTVLYGELEEQMRRALGTKVAIRQNGSKGKIEISYANAQELDRIYELIRQAGM